MSIIEKKRSRGRPKTLDREHVLNRLAEPFLQSVPSSELANGNSSNTALVNIEKYTKKAPALSIFNQPS